MCFSLLSSVRRRGTILESLVVKILTEMELNFSNFEIGGSVMENLMPLKFSSVE